MLRLTARQRAVLADKVPDVTNIILDALAIGVFVGAPGMSVAHSRPRSCGVGQRAWLRGRHLERREVMEVVALMAGVAAIAWFIWLLDWLGRRHDRRSQQGHV